MLNEVDGSPFTSGRAGYLGSVPGQPQPRVARIYVRIQPDGLPGEIAALLDTGSPWSVLDTSIARELGLFNEPERLLEALSTRIGTVRGRVVTLPVTILAEAGDSLSIEAAVFVSEEWTEGTFIGFQGLLDHIRFAIDPMAEQFFFGPCA